ncbi:MAG: hypothetical protein K2J30_06340, partial [Clostridia bacterium]|nr:hypothetical protein [Clostridia bacterium]
MIKFSGRVDNKAKSRVIKQRDRQVGWMMLFGSTMGVLFNIYWIFTKKTLNSGLLASVAVLILLTIAIFVVPSTGVAHGVDWFYTVCIENGTIQKTQFGQPPLLMKIDQIKKVIDDGEYYTVI